VYGFTSYNLLWAQEEATTYFARHISKKIKAKGTKPKQTPKSTQKQTVES